MFIFIGLEKYSVCKCLLCNSLGLNFQHSCKFQVGVTICLYYEHS